MGIEVPEGNAAPAPEQAKTDKKETESSSPSTSASNRNSKKKVTVFLIAFGLLVLAAVLIGVLPDWGDSSDGDDSSAKLEDTSTGSNTSQSTQPLFFESSKGPFDVKIPLFSAKLTEGYASQEELKQDLSQLAKFLLNDAITSNIDGGMYSGVDQTVDGTMDMGITPEFGMESGAQQTEEGATAGQSGDRLEDVDAFETNNQEFSIDRADFVKSDGNLVFAAYSDFLVVWTIDGKGIITQIQMPPLNITDYMGGFPFEPEPIGEVATESPSGGEGNSSANAGGFTGDEEPAIAAQSSIWWNPKPRIEALLLHEDRLTVVISGYGMENSENLDYTPILYDYLGTKIRVYEINGGDLQQVSETDVNGSFRNAFSADENAYVVTQSSINTWDHLLAPVQRWQPQFEGLENDEYLQAVTDLADNGLVESFVDKLLDELQVNGEVDLARLSMFADSISTDNVEESLYIGNTGQAVAQVVAFDMTVGSSDNVDVLQPHIAATFQPGAWGHVYAMGSMIIVADQGWSWIEEDGQAAQKTFLIGFRLVGPKSFHELVGSVPGYLLNPFSLDFVEKPEGSYVRIATTQSFWTPWFGPMEGDVLMVDPEVAVEESVVEPESSTLNQIIVLRVPTESNTDGESVLQQVGSLDLGEPNERFTTVRFFDDFAYAVTFEQIDPFYVIDLSGEQPVKKGELKVPGFSEYLHPIDSDEKFLVAVGQDADDNGNVLGFQISLFDASDSSEPTLVDRLVVEQDKNSWSSSTASWDERAFRFVPLGERTGKLIIPISIYTYQEFDESTGERLQIPQENNFDGFSVFNIENNRITKDFDIDHSFDIPYTGTWECSNWYDLLPERSFVFSGAVMTMKKYTIISTSLSTGETLWTVPIDESLRGCQV